MTRKSLLAASALLTLCITVGHALAQSATSSSSSEGATVYPPANLAANSVPGNAGGLLYFPAGGNSSYYAVPVNNDPSLISALQSIAASMAAMANSATGQTTALNNLAATGQGGRFQLSCAAPTVAAISGQVSPYQGSTTTEQPVCYMLDTQTGILYSGGVTGAWGQVTAQGVVPVSCHSTITGGYYPVNQTITLNTTPGWFGNSYNGGVTSAGTITDYWSSGLAVCSYTCAPSGNGGAAWSGVNQASAGQPYLIFNPAPAATPPNTSYGNLWGNGWEAAAAACPASP